MKYSFLISHLTLEEKASMMSGADSWFTKSVPGKGIPAIRLSDGPHGLRLQKKTKGDTIGMNNSVPAICYPTASAVANSWDEAGLEEMGECLGKEAASEEVSILLGPGVNIKRNPRCGRNFEYFSEDPFLAGKMGAALIRGIQKNGISACVKHFAVNTQETLRMSVDSIVDERTLREIYLPAFEMAVKEADVHCVMTSYNKVNGTYSNENEHLLKDILRNEWGYRGMVVSDWGGNNDRVAGIRTGATLEMPSSNGITDRQIVEAVKSGKLPEKELDEQLDVLLEMIFSTRREFGKRNIRFDRYKHHLMAQRMAEESVVLLKNEDGVLPLNHEESVAIIGDFAFTPRFQGAGSSLVNAWNPLVPIECLKKSGIHISGTAKGFCRNGKRNPKLIKEAVALAEQSDVVLLYLGLDEGGEAEGVDRDSIMLPDNQLTLLKNLLSVNQNIVVVLSCGCVVDMSWDTECKAVVHGFLSGEAGAAAVADLVTGKRNFSGKLSETIPLRYEDTPSAPYYPGQELTAEHREGIYVGYRYFSSADVPVKYPFGFGLSYTQYEYSDIVADRNEVSFTVKNVGPMEGDEVSQIYISAKTNGMFRPTKELKGFTRTHLAPGEAKKVCIPLTDRSFAVWSTEVDGWVLEPGKYDILVGASSEDIRLGTEIIIDGEPVKNPYADELFAAYYACQTDKVSDGAFSALTGRRLPTGKWDRNKPLSENDTILQGAYLTRGFGKILYSLVNFVQLFLFMKGDKMNANNISFVKNLTYRGLARQTGLFNDEQLAAFLKLINGEENALQYFFTAMKQRK